MQPRLNNLKPPHSRNRRNNTSNGYRSSSSLDLLLPPAPIQLALERSTQRTSGLTVLEVPQIFQPGPALIAGIQMSAAEIQTRTGQLTVDIRVQIRLRNVPDRCSRNR